MVIIAFIYLLFCAPQVAYNVSRVTPALELGEGPHWDPLTQSLYFVDLHQGKINRYYPKTKGYFSAIIGTYTHRKMTISSRVKINFLLILKSLFEWVVC